MHLLGDGSIKTGTLSKDWFLWPWLTRGQQLFVSWIDCRQFWCWLSHSQSIEAHYHPSAALITLTELIKGSQLTTFDSQAHDCWLWTCHFTRRELYLAPLSVQRSLTVFLLHFYFCPVWYSYLIFTLPLLFLHSLFFFFANFLFFFSNTVLSHQSEAWMMSLLC